MEEARLRASWIFCPFQKATEVRRYVVKLESFKDHFVSVYRKSLCGKQWRPQMLKMQLTKGMPARKNCSYGVALAQERSYVTLQVAEVEGKDHPSFLA